MTDSDFLSFCNKIKNNWGTKLTIQLLEKLYESKSYPSAQLIECIPEAEDKSLSQTIQALDLTIHLPGNIIHQFPVVYELRKVLSSLIENEIKSDHHKEKEDLLPTNNNNVASTKLIEESFLKASSVQDNKYSDSSTSNFISAVKDGSINQAQYWLTQGADINVIMSNKDKSNHFTPLFYACWKGDVEMVKYLVNAGAALNKSDSKNGYSPLHAAALFGYLKIAQYLVEKAGSASITNCDKQGDTPMHTAARNSQPILLEYLLEHKPLFKGHSTYVNHHGQTPYDIALSKKDQTILNVFSGKRPKASESNNNNYQASKLFKPQPEENKQIPTFGSSLNDLINLPKELNKIRPLLIADTLVSSNPLFAAIANEKPIEKIKQLITQNPKSMLLYKDKYNNNALHIAVMYGKPEVKQLINLLLSEGCSASEYNWLGVPPSHFAIFWGNKEMSMHLIEFHGLQEAPYTMHR